MNTPNTEITKKGIIVIQSLKKDEKQTGEELKNDILRYKPDIDKEAYFKFYNVYSKTDFIKTMKQIEEEMVEGEIFTLHLETHGGECGIGLASGECLSWKTFFDCIRPINEKMGNLLIVVMSMCLGVAIMGQIEPEKRAPYKAFIAADRSMSPNELAQSFAAFYSNYNNLLDIAKGMQALQNEIKNEDEKSPFWFFTAEQVFDLTFDPDRDPKNFSKMKDNLLSEYQKHGVTKTREDIDKELPKLLLNESKRCRPFYCFEDIYKVK